MISHKRTNICTPQKYTCIHYKYTYSDINRQQKQNTCVIFRLLLGILVTVKNSACSQCSFLLQNAHRKHGLKQDGDMFTFTICSHFHRIGIVVLLYSHATKSTPIPPKTPKITLTLFDPPLRTKPNYPLPKLTPQEPQ